MDLARGGGGGGVFMAQARYKQIDRQIDRQTGVIPLHAYMYPKTFRGINSF